MGPSDRYSITLDHHVILDNFHIHAYKFQSKDFGHNIWHSTNWLASDHLLAVDKLGVRYITIPMVFDRLNFFFFFFFKFIIKQFRFDFFFYYHLISNPSTTKLLFNLYSKIKKKQSIYIFNEIDSRILSLYTSMINNLFCSSYGFLQILFQSFSFITNTL